MRTARRSAHAPRRPHKLSVATRTPIGLDELQLDTPASDTRAGIAKRGSSMPAPTSGHGFQVAPVERWALPAEVISVASRFAEAWTTKSG